VFGTLRPFFAGGFCIVEHVRRVDDLPLLWRYNHGAPHRRQHRAVTVNYQDKFYATRLAAGIQMPIKEPFALFAPITLTWTKCSPRSVAQWGAATSGQK
jgi:hypothetical protein